MENSLFQDLSENSDLAIAVAVNTSIDPSADTEKKGQVIEIGASVIDVNNFSVVGKSLYSLVSKKGDFIWDYDYCNQIFGLSPEVFLDYPNQKEVSAKIFHELWKPAGQAKKPMRFVMFSQELFRHYLRQMASIYYNTNIDKLDNQVERVIVDPKDCLVGFGIISELEAEMSDYGSMFEFFDVEFSECAFYKLFVMLACVRYVKLTAILNQEQLQQAKQELAKEVKDIISGFGLGYLVPEHLR